MRELLQEEEPGLHCLRYSGICGEVLPGQDAVPGWLCGEPRGALGPRGWAGLQGGCLYYTSVSPKIRPKQNKP